MPDGADIVARGTKAYYDRLVAQVRECVAQGMTDAQLAKHFKRADGWAYKFRHKHGIKSKYHQAVKKQKLLSRDDAAAVQRSYAVVPAPVVMPGSCFYQDARVRTRPVMRPAIINVTAAVCGDPRR